MAIWLNRSEDGQFQIETFEFVNLIVGGLFAVIALNFTINSTYQVLERPATTRSAGCSLSTTPRSAQPLINCCDRSASGWSSAGSDATSRSSYLFLLWAIPVLVLTMASAVVLVALA